ncbi:MAG TPA: bifunctional riboflavin kinase/FAD synthetase [Methylomirabilota bacterium]|nr:bifunctional riboflavin kinase/FAD synthetase [Methylomirabilota bacterium]
MTVPEKPVRLARLDDLPAGWCGGVVAIGNFDGVHRGHQAVLMAASAAAAHMGVPCLVLTFEPHPRAFLSGRPLFRLTSAPLKAALAAALGFDGTLVLDFDRTLAEESAEDFVRKMLVEKLDIRAAVTGYDFHFGKARLGTPDFLARQGALHGFSVTIVDAVTEGPEAVSSTRIRRALSEGDVELAAQLLGWRYGVAGRVIKGDARGRELGYPTANMALDSATELAHGIYAVRFLAPDGVLRDGVASYGRRPTFGGGEPLLETFVFDFSGDLYDQTVLVSFYGFIRPEQRFDSVEALVARMDEDSIDARAILERTPPGDLDRRIHKAWLDLGAGGFLHTA